MASVNVFVYGTLMADQIAGKLLGRVPASSGATLSNYIRYRVKGVAFPAIVAKAGEAVEGKVRMRVCICEAAVHCNDTDKIQTRLYH